MIIHIRINTNLVSSLPDWDELQKAIMNNMVELHPFGVIPQSCTVEATLNDEELKQFENELD